MTISRSIFGPIGFVPIFPDRVLPVKVPLIVKLLTFFWRLFRDILIIHDDLYRYVISFFMSRAEVVQGYV